MTATMHDVFSGFDSRTRSGLYVSEEHAPVQRPVGIDLFAGAGGFSLGFHQAGWHVAAAVEYDLAATATYLVNLGSPATMLHTGPGMTTGKGRSKTVTEAWTTKQCTEALPEAGTGWISHQGPDEPPVEHFYRADVRDLTGQRILEDLGMDQGEVWCVFGGPPCQGFSTAGKRNVMDPRNSLVFDFARLVIEIQPKAFVMENVPGIVDMLTPEGVPVLDALALMLSDGGMGNYEALRKQLGAHTGPKAVRSQMRDPRAQSEPDEGPTLFDLEGAAHA